MRWIEVDSVLYWCCKLNYTLPSVIPNNSIQNLSNLPVFCPAHNIIPNIMRFNWNFMQNWTTLFKEKVIILLLPWRHPGGKCGQPSVAVSMSYSCLWSVKSPHFCWAALRKAEESSARHSSGTGALNAISSRFDEGEQRHWGDKETSWRRWQESQGFVFTQWMTKPHYCMPLIVCSGRPGAVCTFFPSRAHQLKWLAHTHTHTTLVITNQTDGLSKLNRRDDEIAI